MLGNEGGGKGAVPYTLLPEGEGGAREANAEREDEGLRSRGLATRRRNPSPSQR